MAEEAPKSVVEADEELVGDDIPSVVDARSDTEVVEGAAPDQLEPVLSDLFTAYENTERLLNQALAAAKSSSYAELYQQVQLMRDLESLHKVALSHLGKIWSMQRYIERTRESRLRRESLKDMQRKMEDRKKGLSAVK